MTARAVAAHRAASRSASSSARCGSRRSARRCCSRRARSCERALRRRARPLHRADDRRLPARRRDRPRRDGRGLRGDATRARASRSRSSCWRRRRSATRPRAAVPARAAHRGRRSTRRTSCACSRSASSRVPYLVMERLDGQDLATILRERRTMPPTRSSSWSRQIGAGVDGGGGGRHRPSRSQAAERVPRPTATVEDPRLRRRAARRSRRHADRRARSSARRRTWRPSRRAAARSITAPISTRSPRSRIARSPGTRRSPAGEIADTLYRVVHTAPRRPSALAELPADVDLVLAIGLAKDPAQSLRHRRRARRRAGRRVRRHAPRRAAPARPRSLVRDVGVDRAPRVDCEDQKVRSAGDRIRTCDFLRPRQARYQAALHPVARWIALIAALCTCRGLRAAAAATAPAGRNVRGARRPRARAAGDTVAGRPCAVRARDRWSAALDSI